MKNDKGHHIGTMPRKRRRPWSATVKAMADRPSSCAICAALLDDLAKMEPDGRNGHLWVCHRCNTEEIKYISNPHVFEQEASLPTFSEARKAGRAVVAAAAFSELVQKPKLLSMREKTPGTILVRVRRKMGQDEHAAKAKFKDKPWFNSLKYLGATPFWYTWERPDVA